MTGDVIDFFPHNSVCIPLEPADLVRHARVQNRLDEGASLFDFSDDEIVSYFRVRAVVFHAAKNEALRRGESKDKLEQGVQFTVRDDKSRGYAVKCGRKVEQALEDGVKLSELNREALITFVVYSAARLAGAEDEFNRRGLADPVDPRRPQ